MRYVERKRTRIRQEGLRHWIFTAIAIAFSVGIIASRLPETVNAILPHGTTTMMAADEQPATRVWLTRGPAGIKGA